MDLTTHVYMTSGGSFILVTLFHIFIKPKALREEDIAAITSLSLWLSRILSKLGVSPEIAYLIPASLPSPSTKSLLTRAVLFDLGTTQGLERRWSTPRIAWIGMVEAYNGSARLKTAIRATRQILEAVPSRVFIDAQEKLNLKNYKADYVRRLRQFTKDDGIRPRYVGRVLQEYSSHLARIRQSFGYDILRPNRLSNLLWRFFDQDGTRVHEDVADRARVLRELLIAYGNNQNKTEGIMRGLERIYARKNPAGSSRISYIKNIEIKTFFGLHSVSLPNLDNVDQSSDSSRPNTSTNMSMGDMDHSRTTDNAFPQFTVEPAVPTQSIQDNLINIPEDFDLDRYLNEKIGTLPAERQEELDNLNLAHQTYSEGAEAGLNELTEFDMELLPETIAFTLFNMSGHDLATQGRQEDQEMVQTVLAGNSDAVQRMIRWYRDRLQHCELLVRQCGSMTGI